MPEFRILGLTVLEIQDFFGNPEFGLTYWFIGPEFDFKGESVLLFFKKHRERYILINLNIYLDLGIFCF